MARFLVTGGAGFIGSHLVEYLVRLREEVVVLDDCSSGTRENLAGVADRVRFVEADLCDPAAVADAVQGCNFILHQAARTSVPKSVAEPADTFRVNITGTVELLEAARRAGVQRVVFASSSSVYGGGEPGVPAREDARPDPQSPYAASKLAGEALMTCYSASLGLPCVALRYFNVFGPRQAPDSDYAAVVPRFAQALLKGDLPTIYGDGEQTRDFTYVENVVKANVLAVRQGRPGAVYNVAGGHATSVKVLLGEMAKALGRPAKARLAPERAGDVRHSRADVSRARTELGFDPPVDLSTGLTRTCEWYRDQAGVVA